MSVRPVLFIVGLLAAALGPAMLVPMAVDLAAGQEDWRVFLASAAATELVAGFLVFSNARRSIDLSLRQGFLLTTTSWVVLSGLGALPLVFSDLGLSYTDAFFEAISGLTTTGSTVLTGLDSMPAGILLWRAMLQWIGGVGIIVMGIALLPYLRVGGMQLFRMESSSREEKELPRAAQLAGATVIAYVVLSAAAALAYYLAGMTGFEAVAHAMTTVSTGGYSTSDASLGHFARPGIEWIATAFMILGSLPFVHYLRLARGRAGSLWADSQVRTFALFVAVAAGAMTMWLWTVRGEAFADALRLAAFGVTSVVTTTGYVTADYGSWGSFAVVVFFFLTFMGGCTGSTAGGLKALRFELLAIGLRRQIGRLYQPHAVILMRYGRRPVSPDVTASAITFVFIFAVAFAAITVVLGALGLDFVTAASGAATALANVGPGLGGVIGPAGNFAALPDAAKWVLSAGMLLGRLELFTVLVLFTPSFWRP